MDPPNAFDPTADSLPIIWMVMATSTLLLGGVGWALWPGDGTMPMWPFVGIMTVMSLLSLLGAPFLARGEQLTSARYIMRWALAESVTLFGFTAGYVGAPRWFPVAAAAWGLMLILIAYPRRIAS